MDIPTIQSFVVLLTAGLESTDPAALRAVATAVRDDLAAFLAQAGSGAAAANAM